MMSRYDNEDMKRAIEVLRDGGVILYPTDTVWGVGCDATNPEAVSKVYELKRREDTKSMLVLMENPNLLSRYIDEVPDIAWQLIEATDKPLTLIYPNAKGFAPNLISKDRSIGVRFTEELFSSNLIQRFGKPIVSTSANISGEATPSKFNQISEDIINGVDYVVKYRQDDKSAGASSTIMSIGVSGQFKILRD